MPKFPNSSRYHLFGVVRLPEGILCNYVFPSHAFAEAHARKLVSGGFISGYQIVSLCIDIQKIILEG